MTFFDFILRILKAIGIVPTKDNPNFNPKPGETPATNPAPPDLTDVVTTPTVQVTRVGDVVAKYESGSKGCKSIANTSGDPGGASYGKYQLAANTGNVTKFLTFSGFAKDFAGLTVGSAAFNAQWIKMCDNQAFCNAQYEYIAHTLYKPVRKHADTIGVPSTAAINEMIWSIAVQHGGAKKILDNATLAGIKDETTIINRTYTARRNYVSGLSSLNSALKASLLRRYDSEIKDVLAMRGRNGQ